MKTTIYWFSGTGNSLYVAKHLSKSILNCEIKSIAREINTSKLTCNSEKIGFIFPLYALGMPEIVIKFIKKLDLSNDVYIFGVVTRGAKSWGGLDQLDVLLKQKSKFLSAGFYIDMPGNFIIKYRVSSRDEQQQLFRNAESKMDRISSMVNTNENKIEKANIFFRLYARAYHMVWLKFLNSFYKKFYSDENCNSCGICVNICPVHNIKLKNEKPVWGNNCQLCLSCLHFCPKSSIQYRKNTMEKLRYHHPKISAEEMINQKFHK